MLYKITTECIFSETGGLCQQIDDVVMAGTLSVTLSDYCINKMEKNVVIPLILKFYCRYLLDRYNRKN